MNEYSESTLIEQPAIELFQSLGYEHQNCFHEKFGETGTLGRETPSEVVLVPHLKLALFRLNPDLSEKEKREVKIVAERLLAVLKKEKLVLDWRKRQQTRADVVLTIQNILDEGLPRSYTPAVYQQKCDLVYQHIYDAYYGLGGSVYAAGAQASSHR